MIEISFDLSRSDLQNLLRGFLVGAQGMELNAPLTDMGDLPPACRTRMQGVDGNECAWTAWMTEHGLIVAWGKYDIQGSRRINAYLLLIEWWSELSGPHSLWCHCSPTRPTEWTVGRGRHNCEKAR